MRHTTKNWFCLAALGLLLPLSADAALANEMYGASGAFGQGATGYVDGGGMSYTNDMRAGDWKNHVGGRIYWRSVTEPRQMRMGGLAFVDPAAVPLLFPEPVRKRRRVKRKAAPAAQGQPQIQATAPAPASSPRLDLPKTRPEIAPLKPEAAPKTDAAPGAEAAPAPAAPQAAAPQRRRRASGPKVTTEVWEPTPPVTSAVSPSLPFLKGN